MIKPGTLVTFSDSDYGDELRHLGFILGEVMRPSCIGEVWVRVIVAHENSFYSKRRNEEFSRYEERFKVIANV